jgi:head-tail adaptor
MSLPRLNRKLALETLVRNSDGAGGFIESWNALGVIWAEVGSRAGREKAEAGVPVSVVRYRIVVRAVPVGAPSRPMPGQRFRDGSRIYDIQAVSERDPEGRYLTCHASEEVVA